MANPSVTYQFVNLSVADADQINQNFTDIIAGLIAGTYDVNFLSLTVGGIATFNGNVTFGNATSDDMSFGGSLATSLVPKTDATYNLGSSTIGFALVYLGANTKRLALAASATGTASYTFTYPATAGIAGQGLVNQGSGTVAWKYACADTVAKSADYTVTDTDMIRTINMTTAGSDRTITLPIAANNIHRRITITKVDSGTGYCIIIDSATGADLINGAASIRVPAQWDTVTLSSDGSTWTAQTNPSTILYAAATTGTVPEDGSTFNMCGPLVLTEGTWLVSATGGYTNTSGTMTQFTIAIDNANNAVNSTSIPSSSTGEQGLTGYTAGSGMNASAFFVSLTPYKVVVASGATLNLYLNARFAHTVTSSTIYGWINALKTAWV